MWSKSAFNSDLKICNHMKENFGNLKCEEALKSLLRVSHFKQVKKYYQLSQCVLEA